MSGKNPDDAGSMYQEADMKRDRDPVRFFRNLGRALADDEGMTREQVREELREDGVDPDEAVARVRSLVDRLRAMALRQAEAERLRALAGAK